MAGAMIGWIAEIRERRSSGSRQHRSPDPPDVRSSGLSDGRSPGRWRRVSALLASSVTPLTVACAVLAVSPDFDNLFHTHRTYTHSLGAAGIVWTLVALVAWRLRLPVLRVASVCAAAYASHVLLDWLGRDDSRAGGLMVLWPLTTVYYRSGLNLFLELSPHPRGGFVRLLLVNTYALAREMLILAPPFVAVWLVRVKTLARLASKVPGRDEAA
jgi:membrane-bound metal-dependent hydrolase YbcI (DUF457 family)